MSGKQSGLAAALLVGGYNLSGDISAVDTIGGTVALLDVTGIDKYAHERIGGLRDGTMSFTSFWNDANSVPVLDSLPVADVIASFLVPPQAIGSPAACLKSKQVNYDPSRGNGGELTMKTECQGQGFGTEWCELLTPGLRTDTTATHGADLDGGASSAFGAQAYLQVTAFAGTSVTVTVEHSADNSTWSTLLAFTAVTAAPAGQRVAVANTATVDRYLRVSTSGTFTSATFAAALARNPVAGVAF
jgi:hypothetical protein